jgi:hypothetical protein
LQSPACHACTVDSNGNVQELGGQRTIESVAGASDQNLLVSAVWRTSAHLEKTVA